MRQTMPHVYKKLEHPKDKGHKKEKKPTIFKKKRVKCILNVLRRFSKYVCCPKLAAPIHDLLCFLPQT
jgi:hypothetical protein